MSTAKWYEFEYETVKVRKDLIPQGARLVEAYETATEIIICGDPPEESDKPEENRHNCDAMGCGTLSHVIYRFTKPSEG